MRKIITIMTLTLFFIILSVPVYAGTIKDGFNYEEKSDGTLEITDYSGKETNILIPQSLEGKTVTEIKSYAFFNCETVKRIEIPKTVVCLGSGLFTGCTNLTKVIIPETVKEGYNFFEGCVNLKTAGSIGSGCNIEFGWEDKIPRSAFENCLSLTEVNLPSSLQSIDSCAFSGCKNLVKIDIPGNVTSVERMAFNHCSSLQNVQISGKLEKISEGMFEGCSSMREISIPMEVSTIEENAFAGCSSLGEIKLPEAVTEIKNGAFDGCSDDFIIKAYKNSWAEYYANCSNFKFEAIGTSTIDNLENKSGICGDALTWNLDTQGVLVIQGTGEMYNAQKFSWKSFKVEQVIIKEGVSSIGYYAFENCIGIKKVSMADSVKKIGNYAFSGCINLNNVVIPGGVNEMGRNVFTNVIN